MTTEQEIDMSQAYSDPQRESGPYSLPDVEVFWAGQGELEYEGQDMGEASEAGWYYWSFFPGCLSDSLPTGPFETEAAALADAQNQDW
jgi:hypothetical protein